MTGQLERPIIGVILGRPRSRRNGRPELRATRRRLEGSIERYREDRELAAAVEERFQGGTVLVIEPNDQVAKDKLAFLASRLDVLVLRGPFRADRHAAGRIVDAAWDAGVIVFALLGGELVRCARPADIGLPPVEKLTGRPGGVLVFHPGELP